MKILILSCSTGGGHNSCARYIEEELKENHIECEFKDFFDIVNPKAKELSSKIYLASLKQNGKVFQGAYFLGEKYSNSGITSPVYLANKLHANSLLKYIKENNFTLVITTHLFPSLTLTAINKHNEEKAKGVENKLVLPYIFNYNCPYNCAFCTQSDYDRGKVIGGQIKEVVSDIEFRNIRIEDAPGAQLFDVRITNSAWNTDDKMGRIENIKFSDISL